MLSIPGLTTLCTLPLLSLLLLLLLLRLPLCRLRQWPQHCPEQRHAQWPDWLHLW
jgi:hypothetical protein